MIFRSLLKLHVTRAAQFLRAQRLCKCRSPPNRLVLEEITKWMSWSGMVIGQAFDTHMKQTTDHDSPHI